MCCLCFAFFVGHLLFVTLYMLTCCYMPQCTIIVSLLAFRNNNERLLRSVLVLLHAKLAVIWSFLLASMILHWGHFDAKVHFTKRNQYRFISVYCMFSIKHVAQRFFLIEASTTGNEYSADHAEPPQLSCYSSVYLFMPRLFLLEGSAGRAAPFKFLLHR